MFLTYLILAVALSLSGIAAFYSIAGLTAIFAAAVIPIVVMGSILEIAKLVVTVWLHEYWHRIRWTMKAYLVPAVFLLMVITSMGIFGFLSKAHLDQSVPTGDVAAKVELIDEKIRTQQDNITASRLALQQMDNQVNERLSRSNDDRGAERAVQIRRQQAAERNKLQKEIADAQEKISALNEQRAPIASELRKVEAEVGPVKYIAALIYGDDPDVNVLEKAVRWVIIVLVVVFDPLAIMMLLAFTESYRWERAKREQVAPVENVAEAEVPDENEPATQQDPAPDVAHDYLQKPWCHHVPGVEKVGPLVYQAEDTETHSQDEEIDHHDTGIKEAMRLWKHANPDKTLKDQRQRFEQGLIDQLPWMSLVANDRLQEIGYGPEFPAIPVKGDSWMRTDQIPNSLYRYNGASWIEIDKTIADRYIHNDAYIDYLIEQLDNGQYDPELLTPAEADQIAQRLQQRK